MLTIATVHPKSAAARLGLRPGDAIISVAGQPVHDVIDVHFYASGATEALDLVVQVQGDERVYTDVPVGPAGLGLEFTQPTDDGIRTCNNRCVFCFIDQLPPHMRRTLYLKDDDFRYSFLAAYFVTLTNLSEADWHKLEEQRLSPLYVSVHATDIALRRRLLGNANAPDILDQLARLGRAGIQCHAQVVLCPGINDGAALEQTVRELFAHWPTVQSVAVVPVGLSRQGLDRQEARLARDPQGERLRPLTRDEAQALIAWAHSQQQSFRQQIEHTFLYISDELYLLAGRRVPLAVRYDDFQQLENGVGMVRTLLTEWQRVRPLLPDKLPRPLRATVVCASLIAPTFHQIVHEMRRVGNLDVTLAVADNRFFGRTVTVSGLLTARDMLAAAGPLAADDLLFIPRVALDHAGERFLDTMTLTQFRQATPATVYPVATLHELVTTILSQAGRCRRQ